MSGIPARARGTNNARGILLMLVAFFMFPFLDAQSKYLSQHLPVLQIAWARSFGLLVVVAVVFWPRHGRAVLRSSRPGLQLLRGLMVVLSTILFLTALRFVPLAEVVAMSFVAPLVVTALSGVLLKERAGARRWIAVFVGFAATMIIIRPGLGVMHPAAFLVLGATSLFALYQIMARFLSDTDDASTTLSYTAIAGAVILSLVVPFVWVWPASPLDAAMLAGLGLWAAAAEFAVIKAFEAAPGPVVAPFQYTSIVWATFYGFVLFADLPDAWTLVGAAVLIASGLYSFHREAPRVSTLSG